MKVAIQFENPRFRAAGAVQSDPDGSGDFAVSTVWMGDITSTLPDGGFVVDVSGFLAADNLGIATSLNQSRDTFGTGGASSGAGKSFKRDEKLSAALPESVKVFPKNIEVDAIQTYASDEPGAEVENIAPDPHQVSFTVHSEFRRIARSRLCAARLRPAHRRVLDAGPWISARRWEMTWCARC